jgi:hypothetical protein
VVVEDAVVVDLPDEHDVDRLARAGARQRRPELE